MKTQRDLPTFLFTVDVEDWFHAQNLRSAFPLASWSSIRLRVGNNILRLLDKLENLNSLCIKGYDAPIKVRGTFFVLGWVAERIPHVVREIKSRGHEVASHGFSHAVDHNTPLDEWKFDLIKSKKLLEDIVGVEVAGYRAPNFAVSRDILNLVEDCGYCYDSSYNSFRLNKRYGAIDTHNMTRSGMAFILSNKMHELPVSNLTLLGLTLPWGGGAYFRIMPLPLFIKGVQYILAKQRGYLFYIHPWEIDSEQPRIRSVGFFDRFRHYTNLNSTVTKLKLLLESLGRIRCLTCSEYIDGIRVKIGGTTH